MKTAVITRYFAIQIGLVSKNSDRFKEYYEFPVEDIENALNSSLKKKRSNEDILDDLYRNLTKTNLIERFL